MNQTLPTQTQHIITTEAEPNEEVKPPGTPAFYQSFNFQTATNIIPFYDEKGIGMSVGGKIIHLTYPSHIWSCYPLIQQEILAQNLSFCSTFFLPYLVDSLKRISYEMPLPLADPFLFKGFSFSLPSTALMQKHMDNNSTIDLLRKLFTIDYTFNNTKPELPKFRRSSNPRNIVLPFSFGKDSLLTLALCQELELRTFPVYITEPQLTYQRTVKDTLAESFSEETGQKIEFIDNTFGVFRQQEGWIGWELQLTHYSLMLLPYVFANDAGYIVFANEQSCNDHIIDGDGFRYNPVFEQSHSWLQQNSVMAGLIGGNALSIGSMIEPLHELAIVKILHNRYPQLARFQSSCDLEDKNLDTIKLKRWCENCSKCARIYIFLLANGIDPSKVGIHSDLLREEYKSLYSIFDRTTEKMYGHDQSGIGCEEQIFAFYLAYKRGVKGQLMDYFIENYASEAEEKEEYLHKKYYGIHSTITVPAVYKSRLLRIYHEELDSFVG